MTTRHLVLVLLVASSACTTLGPMPGTTAMSAIPVDRPGAEVQTARVPAFFLSDAADSGTMELPTTHQLAALLEPDRWLGIKGLVLGARSWGEVGDSQIEPMIGMRRRLDERFSIAGIAFGTYARGESAGASYEATRLGGELVLDGTLLPIASWLAIHVQATVSATYLDATGTYCVVSSGDATDCEDGARRVDGSVHGIYSAATAGVSVDIARRPHGVIHGVRAGLLGAIGSMPKVHDGVQQPSADRYTSIGLYLTFGFGNDR